MSTETETTALVVTSPGQTVLQVFSTPQGLDPAIDKIEAEAKALKADISTQEGRDAIRSMAFKLARSKTALDKMGKDLTEDQRKQIDQVNAERKRGWERLEKLQHEIRKPLTDWEDAEKDRVALHESALAYISDLGVFTEVPRSEQVEERVRRFKALAPRNWHEFQMRYDYTVKTVSDTLEKLLAEATKRESEAAELERLRREDAERKQREYEARIAAEAAEKARQEAERIAAENAALERQRVEQERMRIETEKQAALDAAAKAEAERLASESRARLAAEKAEADRIAAESQAKRDADAAVEQERQRVADAKKKLDDETAAREANVAHKKKINNEVLADLLEAINDPANPTMTHDEAKLIVAAIAQCKIRHVRIGY